MPMVTFDDSLVLAIGAVRSVLPDEPPEHLRFVRDILGVLHVIVPDTVGDETLATLQQRLLSELEAYAPGRLSARRVSDTLGGPALLDEAALVSWVKDFPAYLIDRRAVGQDWVLQPHMATDEARVPRLVFYSLKGGVGRSTALALWARHRALRGGTVLVVDLDLEAPGLGAQLLSPERLPAYGVTDWLAQDLVAPETAALIDRMCAESPLADAGLLVVPAFGTSTDRHPDQLMAKLARAYLEKDTQEGTQGFAQRLSQLLQALEGRYQPDLILIDSRAGLHETVAANLLHLGAEVLCFAVDTPATWQGYRYLFGHLKQLARSSRSHRSSGAPSGDLRWREHFKMVNARAGREIEPAFIGRSFELWTDTLYDAIGAADEETAFSFDLNDDAAPHFPLTITRDNQFERLDLMRDVDQFSAGAIETVFGSLFSALDEQVEVLREG